MRGTGKESETVSENARKIEREIAIRKEEETKKIDTTGIGMKSPARANTILNNSINNTSRKKVRQINEISLQLQKKHLSVTDIA